jgi:hypothetical protein
MPRQAVTHDEWAGVQGKIYLLSMMETDYQSGRYFYHTTTYKSLKCILRDGYITGSAEEKKRHKATGTMHDGVVCFTTNPFRHLSNMPELAFMVSDGITHPVYLRFHYDTLKRLHIRPTAYEVTLSDLQNIPPARHQHLVSEEKLKAIYGSDVETYTYREWIIENEWRIKTTNLPLPSETEVFVSSPQQMRALKVFSSFPIRMDQDLMEFRVASHEPEAIRKVIVEKCKIEQAADNTLHKMRITNEAESADSAFLELIRRAETIIRHKDRGAAKTWLIDVNKDRARIVKWLKTPPKDDNKAEGE